jgi:excinuclease ABC subunit A
LRRPPTSVEDRPRSIRIRAASTHNLKRVDADIPLGAITVVTGVSGSGKSSLALDTLYAEGQRRFVESLSAYARQFLDRLPRAEVERLEHVPPAIAIGQGSRPTAARTDVGSMTQLSDLLQLLYGAAAEAMCPAGHGSITRSAPSKARTDLLAAHRGARAVIAAPLREARAVRGLIREGYTRFLADDGSLTTLDAAGASELGRPDGDPILPEVRALARSGREIRAVIDRLVIRDEPRLAEAIAAAFRLGDGRAEVRLEDGTVVPIRATLTCPSCGFSPPPREARLFSSTSALGACPSCEGFGRVASIDLDKVVPDPSRSLLEDAIAPWSTPGNAAYKADYHLLSKRRGLRLTVPWQDLSERERRLIIEGEPPLFPGVRGFFGHLERKRYKMSSRILIARYRGWTPCPECFGRRLQPGSLAYQIDGRSIAEMHELPIEELHAWVRDLAVVREAEPLRARLLRRLAILEDVGLGYLTLRREGRSLSSGEARRVHLSGALGAGVTGTLYVLDEPSIGLHPRDTERLIRLLRALAEAGNTVVVVEHDTDLIGAADHVIELGPGAGRAGGHAIFSGSPNTLARRDTPTGRALRRAEPAVELPPPPVGRGIIVRGARARTLAGFDVEIPLGALTCITGVSGSGKSSFLGEVLARNLSRALAGARVDPSQVRAIDGIASLEAVDMVDTAPIGRSSRSIPATYLGAWDPIRALLSTSPAARQLGVTASEFSFNAGAGRCPACLGLGTITVDMQFLADVTMTCEACGGKRFSKRILDVRWRNKNADEILQLSVDEALLLFGEHAKIVRRLEPLAAVGLGYLGLGQSTATLSGGEAQRLKLAAHLAELGRGSAATLGSRRGRAPSRRARAGRVLLLMDEPTTGLHLLDVARLLEAFRALLEAGATIVVVEHNLEVIRHAHRVIDLGPEGGRAGGRLVVAGSIFDLMDAHESRTGAALARYLAHPPALEHAG